MDHKKVFNVLPKCFKGYQSRLYRRIVKITWFQLAGSFCDPTVCRTRTACIYNDKIVCFSVTGQ